MKKPPPAKTAKATPKARPAAKTGVRTAAKKPAKKPPKKPAAVKRAVHEGEGLMRVIDPRGLAETRQIAVSALDAAMEKKALMPILLDVSERSSYADFVGIVSGRSDRQVEAIASHVTTTMKEQGHFLLGREGTGNGRWTLLDFGDLIVHVFYHPVREVYDLEGLWIDAPRVKLRIPPELQHMQTDAMYDSP